jgi:type IV pilus assembly protein PilV
VKISKINRRVKHMAISKRERAQGVVLIDAMIAIVIFSIGILGMVALQSSAIQLTSSAKNRINAAMLADQVIAQMWTAGINNLPNYEGTNLTNGGTQYLAWVNTISCSGTTPSTGCLPGVAAHPPSIAVTGPVYYNAAATPDTNPNYQVTVTVNWQAPGDSTPHSYVTITEIGQ